MTVAGHHMYPVFPSLHQTAIWNLWNETRAIQAKSTSSKTIKTTCKTTTNKTRKQQQMQHAQQQHQAIVPIDPKGRSMAIVPYGGQQSILLCFGGSRARPPCMTLSRRH